MKTLNKIFTAAALITFASFANAQTEVPNTFEGGTAALATEVNANFDALIDAIDALSAEVDALEAAAPTSDVAGRDYLLFSTWQFIEDQRTRTESTPNDTLIFNFGTTEADVSFSNIGTVTLGTERNIERELGWSTVDGVPFIGTLSDDEEVTDATVDYTQTGNLVEVPDFGVEFYASKDGSILIFNDYRGDPSDEGDSRFEGGQVILIEVETTSPN